jgi:hypothetical protein
MVILGERTKKKCFLGFALVLVDYQPLYEIDIFTAAVHVDHIFSCFVGMTEVFHCNTEINLKVAC